MAPPSPAQLHQASRLRRNRQAPHARARWMMRLVVAVSVVGFIAASIHLMVVERSAVERPRLSKRTGDAHLVGDTIEITRLRPESLVDAGDHGSFRLTWDDATTVDIGNHGVIKIAKRGKQIAMGFGDLGAVALAGGSALTITLVQATLILQSGKITVHAGLEQSQLSVISGTLQVDDASGRSRVVPAGASITLGKPDSAR